MKLKKYLYLTVTIAITTLSYSLYVNYAISGSLFGSINIIQLEPYGGITFNHLRNLEIWRLFASQLIHVKQLHMLLSVLSFSFLGVMLERHFGIMRLFLLWFVSGVTGTLFSTLFVNPPWNLGTGASQAIMGLAAAGIVLSYKKVDRSIGLKLAVGFALVPALVLDLIFAHYPKPGHILGFLVGFAISFIYLKKLPNENKKTIIYNS